MTSTYGRLTASTSRVTIPIPQGACRVRMSVSGVWNDPKRDPSPAVLSIRVLGGPPHRSTDSRQQPHETTYATFSDTVETLREGCRGVECSVKFPAEGMAVAVYLTAIPD